MARISASIPEDLKDALYRAATEEDQPISHIIADALRTRLGGEGFGPIGEPKLRDVDLSRKLDRLASEIHELKSALTARTPPRDSRFF